MMLQPARWPREEKLRARLVWVQRETGRFQEREIAGLPDLLKPNDLLVLNDAATLPASLFGKTERGEPLEVRLLSEVRDGQWRVFVLGAGDWRKRTEDRDPPVTLHPGDSLQFGESLEGRVVGVSDLSDRLAQIQFHLTGADFLRELYAQGRPIQYSYLKGPLPLWQVQSAFGSRPWAVEMPSAGAALPLGLLSELRHRGILLASLTHACGLSSSGDRSLDKALPLGERYEIPERTVELIYKTREMKGRVIAAGTTVMRALEGNVLRHGGFLEPGLGETELLIGPGYVPKIVEGLLTGIHEVEESHFRLAASLLPEAKLRQILDHAEKSGLKSHEFGDLCLIL